MMLADLLLLYAIGAAFTLIALIVTQPPLAMPWQWIPMLVVMLVVAVAWPVSVPVMIWKRWC